MYAYGPTSSFPIDDYQSSNYWVDVVFDADSDGDGLEDWYETTILGTDPNSVDSDGDGLVDGAGGIVPVSAYPTGIDLNGDNWVDGELDLGTDPAVSNVGDVAPRGNLDDKITIGDLLILNQMVTGQIQPSSLELILGDMNRDNELNVSDVLLLQQALLGGPAP